MCAGGGAPPPPSALPNMGIWHSVLFRGETILTNVCPRLVGKEVVMWRDLFVSGIVRLEHLDVIAYKFKMAYNMGVQEVRLRALTTGDGD